MKMQSGEDYERVMAEKAEAAAKYKERQYTPDLYMPKVGEQIQVMFLSGITVAAAKAGIWAHIIHGVSKKGDIYELNIPCLSANQEGEHECPLCKHKHIAKNRFGQDCEESRTSFVNPYVLLNLNKKWDANAEAWVSKTEMKDVDGTMQKVELQPTVCRFLNKTKSFRDYLCKFIEANGGDISGKVVTITRCYRDENGNEIEAGTNKQMSYKFSINNTIPAEDTSKYEVPDIEKFFIEKTEDEMNLFVNTGKWFLPKSGANEGDVIRGEAAPASNQASAPAADSANKYANAPGTTFVTRED